MARHQAGPGNANRTPGHRFATSDTPRVPRSAFNRSRGHKTAFNSDDLIPIFCDEVLPGDTVNLSVASFIRAATPLHPVLDNLTASFFWFFVPNRLVYDDWPKVIGEKEEPDDVTDMLTPLLQVPAAGYQSNSLFDYFGLPVGTDFADHNAMPVRCYPLIWNYWFRDEWLQDKVTSPTGSGPDFAGQYDILKRGKRQDYFTSASPAPQRGPDVQLPLQGNAPLVGLPLISAPAAPKFKFGSQNEMTLTGVNANPDRIEPTNNLNTTSEMAWGDSGNATGLIIDLAQGHLGSEAPYADMNSITSATINALRESFAVQQIYELDARGGSRLQELLWAHFGVRPQDARLQKPEFLAGGTVLLNVNPVATTAPGSADEPVGELAAYMVGTGQNRGFIKSFPEHGYVIGLISVQAMLHYQNGLHQMWSRRGRFDFYWPSLQNIGEQPIYNKELYVDNTPADDEVFGYQEAWSSYRYAQSMVTGEMRSVFPQSLDTWHYAQDFGATRPTLSPEFIESDTPVDRTLAVLNAPEFLADFWFNVRHVRPMPVNSRPGMTRL